jgi:nucleoside-diphosphate-sugar epimerase
MTADGRPTTFVTGAAGFIGSELIRLLVARGHRVSGLARTAQAAERVRRIGAVPVMGDLLEPGMWQDEAAADWVFHIPPRPAYARYAIRAAVETIARHRLFMDRHLLDAVGSGATRRVIYVGDTSCYGAAGSRAITEDESPRPSALVRCFTPAFDRLDGYIASGLPIVTALPGWVYGNGAWFRERIVDPVMSGRRVLVFGKTGPWVSPIHIHDCARALVHLAERGEPDGRYFLVNREPIRLQEFAAMFARVAGRPLRVWRVPARMARLSVGPVLADAVRSDAVFSNIRLRGTGFCFEYPTLEQGLRQIVGDLDEP